MQQTSIKLSEKIGTLMVATLLTLLSFSSLADSSGAQTLSINRADGSAINYYLIKKPNTPPSKVLLLIMQGSDCNSVLKIESVLSDYAKAWPQADLLLIEKYGIDKTLSYSAKGEREDCPAAYLKNDSPGQRVSDIKTVLKKVRKQSSYAKFIALGGSEGAVIANLLAAQTNFIDASIAFNGGGRWFLDDVLHNIALEYKDGEEKAQNLQGFIGFSEHVLNSPPSDLVVSGHGYKWWHEMLSIDQYSVLTKVASPVLIVQSGLDASVSAQKVNEMMLALKESGHSNIEYISYPKLDHGFKNAAGKRETGRVVAHMNVWLQQVLKH